MKHAALNDRRDSFPSTTSPGCFAMLAPAGRCAFVGRLLIKLGVETVSVPRFYPSSIAQHPGAVGEGKTCSACGHILDKLDLRTREWTCPACGARHDRDLNAAINILRVGTSTRTKDDVRPAAYGGPSSFAS